MKPKCYLELTLVTLFVLLSFSFASAEGRLRLSTTTSTQNSGLLDVLLPPFEKMFNVKVDVIPVGTGKALKLAENGDVDVTLVHARPLEDKFVAEGYGVNRRDVMHNDFVIIGPESDPAGIKSAKTADEAFKLIFENKATFISRGDRSGTHVKELKIWEKAGLKPSGKWYWEAGRGMGPTLLMASEEKGYALTDMGTYLTYKGETGLIPIVDKGGILLNVYSVIACDPEKNTKIKAEMADNMVSFLTSPEIQELIGKYAVKEYGMQLFIPCAGAEPYF